jgi:CRP-like cAMP-binding protein
MTLQSALLQLTKGGPERQAIEAGEVDAIIDYSSSNVILFPAARRALREVAARASAESRVSIANSVLSALPSADYRTLLAKLEPVWLKAGEVLHEPGAPIRDDYCPTGCVVCLITTVENHQAVAVGLVGYEGVVGISLVMGADASPIRAVVETSGPALRMGAASFRKAFAQRLSLQQQLYSCAYSALLQARQTIACNCFHVSEARVARWLLMTADRAQSEEFSLTQTFLAQMLGLRRATVTEIAVRLRQRKLLDYGRGRVRIVDRQGLEAAACRCYTRVENPRIKAIRSHPPPSG